MKRSLNLLEVEATTKSTTEFLPCELTPHELLEKGKRLASALNHKREKEDELKQVSQQIKAEVAKDDAEINYNQNLIATGIESRNVACEIRYDWASNTKHTIRLDTHVAVRSEDIERHERQQEMEL